MSKGSVMDLHAIIKVLFILGVVVFIVYNIMTGLDLQTGTMDLTTNSDDVMDAFVGFSTFWDSLIPLLFIFLITASVYLSYRLRASPMLLGISIMMVIIFVIVAIPVANMFEGFGDSESFSGYDTTFPIITGLLENLPIMILIIGAVFVIALYSKTGTGLGGEI